MQLFSITKNLTFFLIVNIITSGNYFSYQLCLAWDVNCHIQRANIQIKSKMYLTFFAI